MEKFDRYDEIDYTGKSNPNIWEVHLEFFFSKAAALKRYAAIKRLHPEAARKTAVRPFFRPNADIEIHQDMIKDFTPEAASKAAGVWQLEFGYPQPNRRLLNLRPRCQRTIRKDGLNTVSARKEISEPSFSKGTTAEIQVHQPA